MKEGREGRREGGRRSLPSSELPLHHLAVCERWCKVTLLISIHTLNPSSVDKFKKSVKKVFYLCMYVCVLSDALFFFLDGMTRTNE